MIRYRWHDLLDLCGRVKDNPRRYLDRFAVLAAAAALAALLAFGLVVAGETELIEADKNAATAPSVAAQVADPAVEPSRPAPAGSATDSERCEP